MASEPAKRPRDEPEAAANKPAKRAFLGLITAHSTDEEKREGCRPYEMNLLTPLRAPCDLFAYFPAYFSAPRAAQLWCTLSKFCAFQQGQVEMWDATTKTRKLVDEARLVAYHGPEPYTYNGKTMPPRPLLPGMDDLITEVEKMAGRRPGGIIFNLYENGSRYISSHQDKEDTLDTTMPIFSFSFGATRDFQLRFARAEDGILLGGLRPEKATHLWKTFALESGDLFVMFPGFQQMFYHGVPKRAKCKQARINATVRFLKPKVSTGK